MDICRSLFWRRMELDKKKFMGKTGWCIGYVGAGIDTKTKKIATVEFGSQFTVSEIIGFLNEFGTPPFVFEKMFAQKEMYYFTENEIRKLNSINDDVVSLASFTVIENFMKKAIQILIQDRFILIQNQLHHQG